MKRLGLAAAAAWMIASPALAQDPNSLTPEELLPLAHAEGIVVVHSFTSRIARAEEAFEAAYPSIDLQGYDIPSTEQIARLTAEVVRSVLASCGDATGTDR